MVDAVLADVTDAVTVGVNKRLTDVEAVAVFGVRPPDLSLSEVTLVAVNGCIEIDKASIKQTTRCTSNGVFSGSPARY